MNVTAYSIAKNFIGTHEVQGDKDNPFIVWCLSLCGFPDQHDEIAWCSAFVNAVCFMLGLTKTHNAMARSWLHIGTPIELKDAQIGFDICIFKRGTGMQGHVGFFGGVENGMIRLLAGNQHDEVSEAMFPIDDTLLGIVRLQVE